VLGYDDGAERRALEARPPVEWMGLYWIDLGWIRFRIVRYTGDER